MLTTSKDAQSVIIPSENQSKLLKHYKPFCNPASNESYDKWKDSIESKEDLVLVEPQTEGCQATVSKLSANTDFSSTYN
jgi:hypothetical protein